jgi:Anti-anti-sigma regulatory factor (antagonist of anti-sigma factor)
MELQYTELENGVRLIKLIGTLDMQGTFSIEVQFARYCAGEGVRVLVDLSGVTYLSSIGIPMLINTARSVVSQDGKMGLVGPIYDVHRVLEITGVTLIIPIFHDFNTAVAEISKETS